MDDERIVDIVYGAEGRIGGLGLVRTYDLIFTDRRLVGAIVAKSGAARVAGAALGGLVGAAIAASVAKSGASTRRASYTGLPLDNIAAADKANFSVTFRQIQDPKVKGLVTKYLKMKVDGKRAFFKLPKQQVASVQKIISESLPRGV